MIRKLKSINYHTNYHTKQGQPGNPKLQRHLAAPPRIATSTGGTLRPAPRISRDPHQWNLPRSEPPAPHTGRPAPTSRAALRIATFTSATPHPASRPPLVEPPAPHRVSRDRTSTPPAARIATPTPDPPVELPAPSRDPHPPVVARCLPHRTRGTSRRLQRDPHRRTCRAAPRLAIFIGAWNLPRYSSAHPLDAEDSKRLCCLAAPRIAWKICRRTQYSRGVWEKRNHCSGKWEFVP